MTTPLHYLPHEIDEVIKNTSDERSRKILRNLWETFEALEVANRHLEQDIIRTEKDMIDLEDEVADLKDEVKSLERQKSEDENEIFTLKDRIEDLEKNSYPRDAIDAG